MSHPHDTRIERNLFVTTSHSRLALAALALSVASAAFFFLIVNP